MAKRLKELAHAIAGEGDELKKAIIDVRENRTINVAKGDQQEQIKKIVVLDYEGGENDTRDRIYLEIDLDESEGEFDAIAKAIDLIFEPVFYRTEEIGSATIRLHIETLKAIDSGMIKALKQIVAGGVGLYFTSSVDTPFAFAGAGGKGFGTYGQSGVGGFFSTLRSLN